MLILVRVISLIRRSLHLNLIYFWEILQILVWGNDDETCRTGWVFQFHGTVHGARKYHPSTVTAGWAKRILSLFMLKKNLHFMNNHYRPGSENLKKKSPSVLYMFLSFFCISQEHVVLNYEYLWEVNRFRPNSP